MTITEIDNKKAWSEALRSLPEDNFLQSWSWREIVRAEGLVSHCWSISQDHELQGAALVEKKETPLGGYLYIPRGPLWRPDLDNQKQELTKQFFEQLGKQKIYQKAMFVRFDPPWLKGESDQFFKHSFVEVQPRQTRKLDLTLSEDELLAQMKPKTRYNIGLAEKKGVTIEKINSPDPVLLSDFFSVLQKTAKRNEIKLHGLPHYAQIAEHFPADEWTIYTAKKEGQTIAAIMVIFYNHVATYLHGGSDYQYRNLMASHWLQWQAIREARAKGCNIYDFWGVAPQGFSSHPWQGITRFKEGFGGYYEEYCGTLEYIYKNYQTKLFYLAKKIKEKIS